MSTRSRRFVAAVLSVVTALLTTACAGDDADDAVIHVHAAASLADAFELIIERYEADHPGVSIELNAGSSTELRRQIEDGAPADVFASADEANVDALIDGGLADEAVPFATTEMILATRPDNPLDIRGLADLARDELLIGLCAPEVPCGRYARTLIERAGVDARPDTEEPDARSLLTKLEAGELDLGLIYFTDLRGSEGVLGIAIPEDQNLTVTYPITVLDGASPHARAFVDFILSAEGRSILASDGFGEP